jgi:hypothetical protein
MSLKGTSYLNQAVRFNLAAAPVAAAGNIIAQFTASTSGLLQISCNLVVADPTANGDLIAMHVQSAAAGVALADIESTVGTPCSLPNSATANCSWVIPCAAGSSYAVFLLTGGDTTVTAGYATFQLL